MTPQENISLKSHNTFGIEATAAYYAELNHTSQLPEVFNYLKKTNKQLFILGGGSNILLTGDLDGLVLANRLKGISVESTDNDHIIIKAMAGEKWDDFVEYCVMNNWGGLENLTNIPGNVGAAPMQNIGAYGVELKDSFHELEALEIQTGRIISFKAKDCQFGYRESFFKKEGKNRYMILSASFRLTRKNHSMVTHYGSIQDELELQKITSPSIKDIMSVVAGIRSSKLPDPAVTGNAGSFFKNPLITKDHFERLRAIYPDIPSYNDPSGLIKTAAGWLIEKAGWKGFREGSAGVHPLQALVLVNYGNATGLQIWELAMKIRESVNSRFNIELDPEVNII